MEEEILGQRYYSGGVRCLLECRVSKTLAGLVKTGPPVALDETLLKKL